MKCNKCDFDNRTEAMFCIECGERFAIKCRGCGALLPSTANFCDKCGKCNDVLTNDEYNASVECIIKSSGGIKEASSKFEKYYIERKLEEFNWNISKTAESIGIERSHLHKKIKALNVHEQK